MSWRDLSIETIDQLDTSDANCVRFLAKLFCLAQRAARPSSNFYGVYNLFMLFRNHMECQHKLEHGNNDLMADHIFLKFIAGDDHPFHMINTENFRCFLDEIGEVMYVISTVIL